MSKTIGSLTIPVSTLWSNRYNWQPIVRTFDRTISGSLVIWDEELINGRKIHLEGSKESGWWLNNDLNTLTAMASFTGTTYVFAWENFSATVIFDHSDGEAITMPPVLPNHPYFFGSIKLLQVS